MEIQTYYSHNTVSYNILLLLSLITKNTKNNKAPDPSNITYETLKHLGKNTKTLICKIFNDILNTGIIPHEWKLGTIYPIPKSKEWQKDINITRPITQLETIRKLFTKILNNRLTKIFTTQEILSPLNFAGLPESNTQQPIHILNNIIEDARENNQEAWILHKTSAKHMIQLIKIC